jgi:hypothetical protein
MKCEFCGEEISEGALACPRCGSPASKPADRQPQATAVGPPPVQQAPAQPVPGQPAQVQQPAAQPVAPIQAPIDPPLAKVEEDFIALAEESITMEGSGEAAGEFDALAPTAPGQAGPISASAIADQTVLPGGKVVPQQVQLDHSLTSGYQFAEGAGTVAGAGEQTADDPFGLNVTEMAPPTDKQWRSLRQGWRYSRWWNITVMTAGIIILLTGITLALYFGVFKKPGLDTGGPPEALKSYVTAVIGGDDNQLSRLTVPGSNFGGEIRTLLKGYEKYGIMSLSGFDAKTTRVTKQDATVEISKIEVEINNEKGTKELVSALDITQPYKLPTTVQMVLKDGQWLVSSP